MSVLTPAPPVPWAVSSPFRMRPGLARLATARTAYEELAEAYEGLRRMVERGYVAIR